MVLLEPNHTMHRTLTIDFVYGAPGGMVFGNSNVQYEATLK